MEGCGRERKPEKDEHGKTEDKKNAVNQKGRGRRTIVRTIRGFVRERDNLKEIRRRERFRPTNPPNPPSVSYLLY